MTDVSNTTSTRLEVVLFYGRPWWSRRRNDDYELFCIYQRMEKGSPTLTPTVTNGRQRRALDLPARQHWTSWGVSAHRMLLWSVSSILRPCSDVKSTPSEWTQPTRQTLCQIVRGTRRYCFGERQPLRTALQVVFIVGSSLPALTGWERLRCRFRARRQEIPSLRTAGVGDRSLRESRNRTGGPVAAGTSSDERLRSLRRAPLACAAP